MKTRLSEIITQRGLERRKIAKDLHIERRTFDNYVNEVALMNSDIIARLAKYLHVSTDYLLGVDQLDDAFLNEKIDNICNELKEIIFHINIKE